MIGDCELYCINDYCAEIYSFWTLVFGSNKYAVSHNEVCPHVFDFFGLTFEKLNELNCSIVFQTYDFNNDNHLNLREFILLGTIELFHRNRTNVNCSWCTEYYDYYVSPSNNQIMNITNFNITVVDTLICD